MQRYESYKPSGATWIGEVPSHWEVQPLRAVTTLKSDKNRPDLPVLSVYRAYGVIRKDSRDDNHNATSLDTGTYKVVKPGDLVVNKMKAWQGSMGVSAHEGVVSPAYITCATKTDRVQPSYLHYLLRSTPLIGVYNALSYGVRVGQWDMHYEDFKQILIPLPPKNEQDRIITFLDKKTAEIDTAIAKKERLIELLLEQKGIHINQAVIKGMNLNAHQRDSGVAWIGKIPAHWQIKSIKHLGNIVSGFSFPSEKFTSTDTGCRVIKISNIQTMRMDWGDLSFLPIEFLYRYRKFKINKGDLVFALTRPVISTGIKAAIVHDNFEMLLNQRNAVLRLQNMYDLSWMYFLILDKAFTKEFENQIDTTGQQPNISPIDVGNIKIPVPPIGEQIEISKMLKRKCQNIDFAVSTGEKQIVNLVALKSALISSVVTGQMKI